MAVCGQPFFFALKKLLVYNIMKVSYLKVMIYMKKFIKVSFSVLAVALILSLSVISCFAKGGLTLAKDVTADKGDTVTYTLYLADCESPVTDMDAMLFYDDEYLELDKESVDFHDLIGVIRNVDLDGCITFVFSAINNPVDFSKRTPIISANFKVKKGGKSAVKYFVKDLDCGTVTDNAPAKEFTFTCDYVVHTDDGDKKSEKLTPVLLDDKDKIDAYQGDFVNYEDGKGEQNGAGENHSAVTGAPQDVVDVTKNSGSEPKSNTTIIITVAVIVIALAVGIVLILRKVFSNDNVEEENTDEEAVEESDENE